MKYPKELRNEVRRAREMDWTIKTGGSGHLKWYDPSGRLRLVSASTPNGGRRSNDNTRARLKKMGVCA